MMSVHDREQTYLKLLCEGEYTVSELSKRLFISEPTVRRDILVLERKELLTCRRGVVKLKSRYADQRVPLFIRNELNNKEKQEIALMAVRHVKDGDVIMRFLRLIGVEEAMQSFEQVRLVKSVRNKVNRLVNCETANLNKTVMAASRQVAHIKRIDQYIGLENIAPNLREAARLRLAHPEAPLQELVDLMEGRVSKSGMNHRLRKLEKLAEELPGGDIN